MNRAVYSLAWIAALPLALARLWWRGRREPGYRQHVAERLGLPPRRIRTAPLLWLHAVSVGETRAAEPLVDALLRAWPDHDLLLTHMTPTGRATGAALFAHYGARLHQVYLPYDTTAMARRFLRNFAPQIGILMETEIWPNLMDACNAARVPVALVNARLSARSLARAERLGILMRQAAIQLTAVGAQTEADAARIRSLGAPSVVVTGSIKFDVAPATWQIDAGLQLRRQIGARPVLLCASTREGEEALLLDALSRSGLPDATLLLLVPRHPQRFEQVAQLVQARGLSLQRRSQIGNAEVQAAVLLGDSMGEMAAYCAACDVAWIGGSLLPLGGQNPIEACALGKPVLLGPHTFNFAEICDDAIAAGAALRIDDADAMLVTAGKLLRDPARRQQMGQQACAFAQQHRGATARTVTLLAPLISASKSAQVPFSGSAER